MKAAISATYFALSVTVLLLSWDNYKSALGQAQQQFQNYQNPTLGVSIQYPSDWELQEESNDKLRFIKQEGFVTADLNVENLDEAETTLSEYANTRVNELQAQRPELKLISKDPITISNKPAQKVVYTFEREEDGKTNKVMRIWTINEGKLYTLAYIAESNQYDRFLPAFQRMEDSFKLSDSDSGSSTTQVQSSDGNCDPSYPDVCIKSPPPALNCPDIPNKNFKVIGSDPHGFDRDNDGIGCESTNGGDNGNGNCDPSYPDVCIRSPPPALNCPDIPNKNFKVIGSDPHGFDRDNDGIGCESANENTPTPEPEPSICYFDPMDKACEPVDGKCPGGFGFNEQDRCIPTGECPEGYGRADEDETGTCFEDSELVECEDGSIRFPQYCRENEPIVDECEVGFELVDGICQPLPYGDCPSYGTYNPETGQCEDVSIEPLTPTLTPTPTPEPTQGPTPPTPSVDPNLLTRSQPQCEFGVNPETGLCNTEDIPSEPGTPTPKPEPVPSTPVPTTTPEEEFSTEDEPEEDVAEEPEEDIVEEEPEEEPEDEPEGNGEPNEDNTTE